MGNNIFPIGFWNVLSATQFGVEGVKDWVDFGATLTMTGFYDLSNDKEEMLKILDECYAKNLKMIFCDRRMTFLYYHKEDFLENFKKLISDFASHPAIYGFWLGDEPYGSQVDDAVEVIKLFRELCPDKEPYVNLLPWVPKLNDTGLIAAETDDYRQEVLDFVKRSGVKILSYDCYMQMCEERRGVLENTALDSYYYNLNMFQSVAQETGAELWYTTLAVGHGMYKCPDQDCFRWEINTAVAHGVKSLFYWYMYADGYNFNYRYHPIDMLFERTDTFRYASAENRIFQQVYGPSFCKLRFEKAYHAVKSYGGTPLIEDAEDELIKKIETNVGTPMIVSRVSKPDEPDWVYYAVVNNSQTEAIRADIYFADEDIEVYNIFSSPAHKTRNRWRRGNKYQLYYSPGQMWVLALKKA